MYQRSAEVLLFPTISLSQWETSTGREKILFKAIGEEQKINVHVNIHKQIQSHIYLSYF